MVKYPLEGDLRQWVLSEVDDADAIYTVGGGKFMVDKEILEKGRSSSE